MFKKLLSRLNVFSDSAGYWLIFIVGGLLTLSLALLYQFAFDEWPCVLCIQIRLWFSLLVIVSILGLVLRKHKWLKHMPHLLTLIVAVGLTERSYMLLGTERGFVFGDCGFNVGLPEWFAVGEWVPWLYQVESSCGYTPELILGITMAEALMLMSIGLLILSSSVLLARFVKTNQISK